MKGKQCILDDGRGPSGRLQLLSPMGLYRGPPGEDGRTRRGATEVTGTGISVYPLLQHPNPGLLQALRGAAVHFYLSTIAIGLSGAVIFFRPTTG